MDAKRPHQLPHPALPKPGRNLAAAAEYAPDAPLPSLWAGGSRRHPLISLERRRWSHRCLRTFLVSHLVFLNVVRNGSCWRMPGLVDQVLVCSSASQFISSCSLLTSLRPATVGPGAPRGPLALPAAFSTASSSVLDDGCKRPPPIVRLEHGRHLLRAARIAAASFFRGT